MSAQSLTQSEIEGRFKDGILPEFVDPNDRDSDNLLKDTYIKTYVASLKTSGKIPKLSTMNNNEDVYRSKVATLITSCKTEYNYYYTRYVAVLGTIFQNSNALYMSSAGDTAINKANLKKSNDNLKILNTKLNDLIQIIQGISDDMLQVSSDMDATLNKLQADMRDIKEKLKFQTKIINSNQDGTKISREMLKYTEENARYTDNLLKMYSFLNVVALGLLIYIYRAAN